MEKVLISGGAGFVDRKPPGPDHTLPDGVEFIKVDARPDVIIHAAIIVPALSERFGRRLEGHVRRPNVGETEHNLQTAKQSGVKGFIYTSCCVVGIPLDICDVIQESMVLKESSDTMATCSLRPSVLCGPGDDRQGEPPFIVGDGQNLWDVTYATNVADAHVLAAENLMSSMTGLLPCHMGSFGHTPPFEIHIPEKLAYLVVLICGFLTWVFGTTTTLSRGSARDVCSVRYANGEKAKLVLGYRPQVGIETDSSCPYLLRYLGLCSTYGDRITNAAGM
ncbi:hypothetical protein BDV41DRAFT_565781 [Aspergillus transmontanensis]|uniref:3-beta hydroxysteroid dehydrogenase/isomerase domain-containing protein n=1 Tax=Aspergillus transmontanensis TaxID=1034304 RepID=A0A5N6VTF4_9EURO|nr:hypothetical protein BDV41DRAFT_565781 [Aspergillus transmontanensis]